MIKLFTMLGNLFKGMLSHADDTILDHVPVQTNEDSKKIERGLKKARENARKRHGKPFNTEVKIQRVTEKSRDLLELDHKSNPVKVSLVHTPFGKSASH